MTENVGGNKMEGQSMPGPKITEGQMRKSVGDIALPRGDITDDFDKENAFLLYANFCGDVIRTAHALGTNALVVTKLADNERWNDRLAAIIRLKQSTKPGDLERGLNRAMNFVQAQRMRLFVGRLLKKFTLMDDEELEKYCLLKVTKKLKSGEEEEEFKANLKPFADLAAAMEKCHQMSYLALNDTATERVRRNEAPEKDVSATELSQAMADAMAAVGKQHSPQAQIFEEQLKAGQELQDQRLARQDLKEEVQKLH